MVLFGKTKLGFDRGLMGKRSVEGMNVKACEFLKVIVKQNCFLKVSIYPTFTLTRTIRSAAPVLFPATATESTQCLKQF